MARITQLRLRGYRSIGKWLEISLPEGQPVVLLGENNAGKSNVVRALNLVLGQSWPGSHEPEDHEFFDRDRNNPIRIAITFDDNDRCGGRWTELHWKYEPGDPGASFYGFAPDYDQKYVSGADRDTCSCMLIEADRNLRYQLSYSSKYTFLSRLMRRFHGALESHEDIKGELEVLFENTKAAFKKMPEFQGFVDGLQKDLTNLVASMTHQLDVDFEAYNPVNFFHALGLHASEDGEPRTLEEMGTGEQQILAMAFAHAYAKAFHTGVLLVIEEPEAHLHPLAQNWLSSRLSDMCHDGLQLVITTHSPAFIDILNLEGMVLVRKTEDGTSIVQIDREDLVAHCISTGAPIGKTTTDNILPFYAANSTKDILEGFFANKVVLVEGPTESLSLPIYLRRAGFNTAKEGVAIIGVQGKGNLAKWRRLFTAFEIPCYIIFDSDGAADDKNGTKRRDVLAAVGHQRQRGAGGVLGGNGLASRG